MPRPTLDPSILPALREQVLAAASARAPLILRGAGTKDFLGEYCVTDREATANATLLDTRVLNGVVAYEPTELVITAGAGTRLSGIEALLATQGQSLAFEPPRFGGDPTLGGIVAAGLSGPRRASVGATRDFVLGATLLDGRGEVLRFGGQVMKNVAGFDVSRLLCGSFGLLGLITQVSLKVLPLPPAETTLRFALTSAAALQAFQRWAGQSWPVSATAYAAGSATVRLSGATAAVSTAARALGGEPLPKLEADHFWAGLRDQTDPWFTHAEHLWRLSVPTSAPLPAELGEPLIEWGGALRWHRTTLPPRAVRAWAEAQGGTAWHWRGGVAGQRLHPLTPAVLAIHRRLQQSFDPAGVFNPGRLLADAETLHG